MFQRKERRPIVELALDIRIMELCVCRSSHICCPPEETVCCHHFSHAKFAPCKLHPSANKLNKIFILFHFTEIPELLESFRRQLWKTHREIPLRCGNSYHEWQHNPPARLCRECLFELLQHLVLPTIIKQIT
jgi:hypothetical protein